MNHSTPWNLGRPFPKVAGRLADDWKMSGPTFDDIRRRFGTIAALSWIATLWRWGLLRAGARRARSPVRYARRRSASRAASIAQWVVLATVVFTWVYWAFLIVKGVTAYVRGGS